MTANQKKANHKLQVLFLDQSEKKKQNLVFEHMIRQVNVSCPPSLRLNTGKEGMIAGYKDGEDWHR